MLPTAPANLTASTGVDSSVVLMWSDQSSNESGFQIERKGGAGSESYRQIGTVPTEATTYRDSAVQPGVPYTYRVRAVNARGVSAYSNEARATPLPALHSLGVRPARVRKGKPAKGTVTLTGVAPVGGARVLLTATLPSLIVPGSVTVKVGKRTATFTVKANKKKRAQGSVSATYGGVTKTVAVTVLK
jgi:hypothetical protein